MKKKKVSIIVPIYNTEKYLKKCLDSIINQTYQNIEIILINDGSTDSSGKICDEYSKKDERIKVIHKKNGGVSSARNLGLNNISGDYVCFIDSDDYVELNMINDLVNNIKNNEMIITPLIKQTQLKVFKRPHLVSMLFDKNVGGYLWNKLYLSSIIKEKNLKFDENITICEDVLFNYNYLKYCERVILIDKKYYFYNCHEDSALNKKFDIKWLSCLDAYNKMYLDNHDDLVLYNFCLLKINAQMKIKLNGYNKKDFSNKYFYDTKFQIRYLISSKEINKKKKIKIYIYYHFRQCIYLLKKVLGKK